MKRKHLQATTGIISVLLFMIITQTENLYLLLSACFMVLCRAAIMVRELSAQLPEFGEQVIKKREFGKLFCLKLFIEILPFLLTLITLYLFLSRKKVLHQLS